MIGSGELQTELRHKRLHAYGRMLMALSLEVAPNERGAFRFALSPELTAYAITNAEQSSSRPLVLLPTKQQLLLVAPTELQDSGALGRTVQVDSTRIGRPLSAVLNDHAVFPTEPVYESHESSERLLLAAAVLRDVEAKDGLRHLSGKEFEVLVRDILASAGLTVQQNLRIEGADVDLFFCVTTERRSEFVLVECKHQARSGKPASISQVLRLYGLREVVRSTHDFNYAVLVSSTGVSSPGMVFSSVHHMDAYTLGWFLEWLAQLSRPDVVRHPVFKVQNIDSRRRISLPQPFLRSVGVEPGEAIVLMTERNRAIAAMSAGKFRRLSTAFREPSELENSLYLKEYFAI